MISMSIYTLYKRSGMISCTKVIYRFVISILAAQQRQGDTVFVQKTNPNPRPIVSHSNVYI